jgi:hypothetical protein
LEKAFEHLLERRPIAAPNCGFLLELIRYEKEVGNKDQNKQTDDKENPVDPVTIRL